MKKRFEIEWDSDTTFGEGFVERLLNACFETHNIRVVELLEECPNCSPIGYNAGKPIKPQQTASEKLSTINQKLKQIAQELKSVKIIADGTKGMRRGE